MLKSNSISFIIFLVLLAGIPSISSAQTTDFCNGIAEEIVYNQEIEASINDGVLFGRYCFAGRPGDVVSIQITGIEGNLVLSGALSDRFVNEIYEEFTPSPDDGSINISFTLPRQDSYHLLISRENFANGTSSGNYRLSLTSDNTPLLTIGDDSIFPEMLENYTGHWSEVIEELTVVNSISSDREIIFNLESAFFDGLGSFFTPIARDTLYRDVIVSAELNFTSDSDSLETCSLLAQVIGQDTASTFLEVGIDNQGNVFWVDASQNPMSSGSEATALDLNQSQHLLFIVQSTTLTIYLNGQRLVENIEISARSGSFGIALLGKGMNSRCEASNIWGYSAPLIIEGLCEATTAININRRVATSTTSAINGIIEAGDYVEVITQIRDGSGVVWYQLDDGSFVREDVILLSGDCDDLPMID